MHAVIIEQGHGYTIASHGNGTAYAIVRERDAAEFFVQGDDATALRAEYDELKEDAGQPNTRASRFTWRETLDTMLGAYFD